MLNKIIAGIAKGYCGVFREYAFGREYIFETLNIKRAEAIVPEGWGIAEISEHLDTRIENLMKQEPTLAWERLIYDKIKGENK